MVNMVNTASASTLEKCKALLQEAVTELNSSASNSEEIAPPDLQELVLIQYTTGIGVCIGFSIVAVAMVSTTFQQRRTTATKGLIT